MNRAATVALASIVLIGIGFVGATLFGGGGPGGPATPDSPGNSTTSPPETTTRPTTTTTRPTTTTTPPPATTGTNSTPTTTPGNDTNDTPGNVSFALHIESITNCGPTCRNVTSRLKNDGTAPANNVTVVVRIYADDALLWQDTEQVGRLEVNESYTSSRKITLGPDDMVALQQNDGFVTIETVVKYDGGSETFTRRRKVL